MSLLRRFLLAAGGGGVRVKLVVSSPGTSVSGGAILHHVHRKLFYHNGYYWIFYYDGSKWVYRTSSDGESWSGALTALNRRYYGRCGGLDVRLRDGYAHIRGADYSGGNYNERFRRGSISGQTISWESEKTLRNYVDFFIGGSVDKSTTGRIWVSILDYAAVYITDYEFYRSDDGGSSFQLDEFHTSDPISSSTGGIAIVRLRGGKMMSVYKQGDNILGYYYYNGSSWSKGSLGVTAASGWGGFSVCSLQNYVYFVYLKSNNDIGFRFWDGSWQDEEKVQTGVSSTSFPVLCLDESADRLICFWAENNKIFLKRRIEGDWDVSPTELVDESTDKLTANYGLTCYERVLSGHICIAYLTKLSSPYTIKHAIVK